MTQEIKVNLALTLEGEIQQSKTEVENFINDLMINVVNTKAFSLQKYEVKKIKEEAEIYAPDPLQSDGVWEFVEKNYPRYYSCNEIGRNDDLCKIINGELNGDAEEILNWNFREIWSLPRQPLISPVNMFTNVRLSDISAASRGQFPLSGEWRT